MTPQPGPMPPDLPPAVELAVRCGDLAHRVAELEAALREIADNHAHHDAFNLSQMAERVLTKGQQHD